MKKRVIPLVLIDSGGKVVISKQFNPWRTVGMLMQQIRLHDKRDADELIILDINASSHGKKIPERILKIISKNIKIPVTVGGGIKSVEDAKRYINLGADKVCICSLAIDNYIVITDMVKSLGSQAIVVNVNYVWFEAKPYLYDYRTSAMLNIELGEFVKKMADCGAGEIILTSVERDGMQIGFDQEILLYLDKFKVTVPILISGGSGNAAHYKKILTLNADAAIGATIFALTEHTPSSIRKECEVENIPMRQI